MPDQPDVGRLAGDLRLACLRISRRVRFEPDDGEIAPHQYSVLVRLENGPLTPGRLAEIEKVAAPSMTRTVAGLADAGLVRRGGNPADRRQVVVHLTPAGHEVLRRTRARRDLWISSRLARLTPEELADLARATAVLAKVAAL